MTWGDDFDDEAPLTDQLAPPGESDNETWQREADEELRQEAARNGFHLDGCRWPGE